MPAKRKLRSATLDERPAAFSHLPQNKVQPQQTTKVSKNVEVPAKRILRSKTIDTRPAASYNPRKNKVQEQAPEVSARVQIPAKRTLRSATIDVRPVVQHKTQQKSTKSVNVDADALLSRQNRLQTMQEPMESGLQNSISDFALSNAKLHAEIEKTGRDIDHMQRECQTNVKVIEEANRRAAELRNAIKNEDAEIAQLERKLTDFRANQYVEDLISFESESSTKNSAGDGQLCFTDTQTGRLAYDLLTSKEGSANDLRTTVAAASGETSTSIGTTKWTQDIDLITFSPESIKKKSAK